MEAKSVINHGYHSATIYASISTVVNKLRGRPSQPSGAKQRILDAARTRFETDGYIKTSLRSIARQADVDHALVSYYYGSKEGLFKAVTELVFTPAQGFDAVVRNARPDQLPEALLHTILALWDRPDYQLGLERLLSDAISTPASSQVIREYLQTEMIRRLTDYIGGPHASRRAAAAAALISGVFFTRYLLKIEPVASLSAQELATQLSPALRAVLTN